MKFNFKQIKIFSYTLIGLIAACVLGILFLKNSSNDYYYELLDGKKIVAQTANTQNIVDIKRQIAFYEDSKDIIEESFVSKDRPVEFIEFLETLGNESGVVYATQSVEILEKDMLSAIFRVEGDWQELSDFLLKIETLSAVVTFELIRVSNVVLENGDFKWVLFGQLKVPVK